MFDRRKLIPFSAAALLLLGATAHAAAPAEASPRIVTLGGAVTETVFALGAGSSVVGIDDSSVGAHGVGELPKVGYYRDVSAEGILSLRPTLILGTTDAGPPPVLEQLRRAGARLVLVPATHTADGARDRVRAIATALEREAMGKELIATIDRELARAASLAKGDGASPKVLFLFSPGHALSVSGEDTAADEMIRLAGGVNAVSGYKGYKPLSAESAIVAAPEVIVVTTATAAHLGGADSIVALPGLAATPAGKAGRVVILDDLFLLGFGPRTGAAAATLAGHLHPAGK